MHRFRKKSDTKHTQPTNTPLLPPFTPNDRRSATSSISGSDVLLPEVTTSDFRTSLILPDLSRRFSLLRISSGDQLSWEDLKSKFADQRARGARHQISEEEEDMLLDTLGRIRPLSNSDKDDQGSQSDSPSKGSVSRRGYNNLFGASSRFRDYNYIRSVTTQRSAQSISSKTGSSYTESLRPMTPEDSMMASSIQSTPNSSKAPSEQTSPLSVAEHQLSKVLGPNGVKRASLALQQAIKEMEEEVEEEIVMPRRPVSRMTDNKDTNGVARPLSAYETGTAISADVPVPHDREDSPRASPIPTQTHPGYIPGMPRPVTPHMSIEAEEQRSHSTTPRATSPSSLHFRRDSESQPRPPLNSSFFLARSANGRFTPDANSRDTYASDNDTSLDSFQSRRRPVSPLTGGSFQPMSIGSTSRPSTPSNVVWTPSPASKHSRDTSWQSDGGTMESSDIHQAAGVEHSKSSVRSLRSPALPDSPLLEGTDGEGIMKSIYSVDARPISPLSPDEMGFISSRVLRSPTPTQEQQRSPTTSSFNLQSSPERKRHSRHNSTSPPAFNFGSLNTLPFSPIVNSSRSSLESEGSSYHSWEGDHTHNRPPSIFDHVGHQQPWHALTSSDKSSTSLTSTDDLTQAEETLKQYAGLTKEDIGTIQTKLVADATTRLNNARERTSSLRKRRPSTSQAVYSSPSRVASPPPPGAVPQDMIMVVQSESVPPTPPPISPTPPPIAPTPTLAAHPMEMTPSQRTRELAKALFGSEDESLDPTTPPESTGNGSVVEPTVEPIEESLMDSIIIPSEPPSTEPSEPPSSEPSPAFTPPIQAQPTNVLEDIAARARLTMEIQRRTTEATAKYGSSHTHRKVAIHEISNPTMVASSTSLNTVALPTSVSPVQRATPSASPVPSSPMVTATSGSKFGSRIKRLRGTLRSKQPPTGDEVTPFPYENRGPTPIQTSIDPAKLQSATSLVVPMSAMDTRRQKEPVPSPPASAGPGLKGFMARLRGKQRAETNQSSKSSIISTSPGSISSHSQQPSLSEQSTPSKRPFQTPTPHSPLAHSIAEKSSPPLSMVSQTMFEPLEPRTISGIEDEQAVKKFLDAAATLGLDQDHINDLLARKASTSSRGTSTLTGLTRNNTITSTSITSTSIPEIVSEDTQERTDGPSPVALEPIPPSPTVSKQSVRKSVMRRSTREGDGTGSNAIVRRTIILPSDPRASTSEFGALVNALGRKASNRRKRASVQSNRSVQERVPTPPPRSSTSKRFSTEPSPPVPHLPQAFAASTDPNLLQVPRTNASDTGSGYDSFYEMYSGEPKNDPGGPEGDLGPALEVVELANGETIWQIINGLRDDDAESQYRRTSFDSEYSTADGMQVFFKERRGSKGSVASFVSRKKSAVPRPETKVFYSSSAQIGKLIENLSSGLEAGSFNFQPTHTKSASHGSDVPWLVEEPGMLAPPRR